MNPTSILIVAASTDARESTSVLRVISDALDARDDVRVTVMLLLSPILLPDPEPEEFVPEWSEPRVVDDLRTWLPATVVQRLGARSVADRLRGARLRWWIHQAAPDVVILNDGLGLRIVEHLRTRPFVVSRLNRRQSSDRRETETVRDPDLVIAQTGTDPALVDAAAAARHAPVLWEHDFGDVGRAPVLADSATRTATRIRLGVPLDATAVAGWGGDGWLDGPDIFIRALWALRDRHGIDAYGIWFGSEQPEELQRLDDEAARCGLADRYITVPYRGLGEAPDDALCADAVLLPARAALVGEHLDVVGRCGLRVATFDAARVEQPEVLTAPDLDVDALADRLVDALEGDRAERARQVLEAEDPACWAARLVEMIREQRG